jgi:FAD/FMN-containing dehydrogenase
LPANPIRPETRTWRNWAGTVVHPVVQTTEVRNRAGHRFSIEAYNNTTSAIQRLIGLTLHTRTQLRATGSGWSFSAIAATDGVVLDARNLDYRTTLQAGELESPANHPPGSMVLAQGGSTIHQLDTFLAGIGKSLPVTGSSNGSTIAGAISTGLHGSVPTLGAMQDQVRALHLVTGPNRHVWVEPASNPIVCPAFAERLGAELIRDDAIFDAARVSLGSFGIIHGVVLEVVDLFWLRASRHRVPFGPGLRRLIDTLDFTHLGTATGCPPHHFEVLGAPLEFDEALVTVIEKHTDRPRDSLGAEANWELKYSRCAFEVSEAMSASPKASLFDIAEPYDGLGGLQGSLFRNTTARGAAVSSAMGLPLGRVGEALDAVHALLAEGEPGTLWQLRYVAPSTATLAFTHHAPRTCVFEVLGPGSPGTMELLRKIWARLEDLKIPHTFHWGGLHELNRATVREAYGADRVESWLRARRALLPSGKLRALFSNEMLRNIGLAD